MLFTSLILMLCFCTLILLCLKDRKKISQSRREPSSEAILRTAQMLAHDIRKPFSMLRTVFSHLDESAFLKDDFLNRNRASLEASIREVESYIDDMLSVGKNHVLNTEPVSLRKVVYDSVNQQLLLKPDCRARVTYEFSNKNMAQADGRKIKRVLDNLISNALYACQDPGAILVKIDEVGEELQTTVFNTGSFIKAEDRERVFEAFYTSGKMNGTGLGLSIAKQVIEKHGGKIWIESDELRGTAFVFSLAKTDVIDSATMELVAVPEYKASEPVEMHNEQTRLVVVEDEEFLRSVWADLGKTAVKTFKTPNELIAYCEQYPKFLEQIECVVTDFYFADQSGLTGDDVADSLRKLGFSKKIFLSSERSIDQLNPIFQGRVNKDPYVALREAFT